MKRAFVTGATGLLGPFVVDELVQKGYEAVALVRDSTSDRILDMYGTTVVRGDVCDYRVIERVLHEYAVDVVVHLASQTQVRISDRSPFSTFETNIRGTYTVLEACRSYGKCERVLVASSDKSYGRQTLPYHEDQPLEGRYPYDVSKSCGDLLAQSYFHTYGLPVVIVRCSNLYGPGDMNWQRIVPASMRFACLGEPLTLRGGGKMKRDYFHVKDAALAYMACVKAPHNGFAFNFGSGTPVELRFIVERVLAHAGCDRKPEVIEGSPHEIADQWMDTRKARSVLGWEPTIALDDGLRETVEWYRSYLTR